MNKTKIEWCDYTWNPVIGCKNDCWYCYAKKINNRFKWIPNFDNPDLVTRLGKNSPHCRKKPSKIFIGSMCDLFGDWVPDGWIEEILKYIKTCPQHTYLFLTKNPRRYKEFIFSENCWLGTTITNFNDGRKLSPLFEGNAKNIKFVSLEPLLDNDIHRLVFYADWLIVGLLTGQHPKPNIKRKTIHHIINSCISTKTPLFIKNSLRDIWGDKLIQEYPK